MNIKFELVLQLLTLSFLNELFLSHDSPHIREDDVLVSAEIAMVVHIPWKVIAVKLNLVCFLSEFQCHISVLTTFLRRLAIHKQLYPLIEFITFQFKDQAPRKVVWSALLLWRLQFLVLWLSDQGLSWLPTVDIFYSTHLSHFRLLWLKIRQID